MTTTADLRPNHTVQIMFSAEELRLTVTFLLMTLETLHPTKSDLLPRLAATAIGSYERLGGQEGWHKLHNKFSVALESCIPEEDLV